MTWDDLWNRIQVCFRIIYIYVWFHRKNGKNTDISETVVFILNDNHQIRQVRCTQKSHKNMHLEWFERYSFNFQIKYFSSFSAWAGQFQRFGNLCEPVEKLRSLKIFFCFKACTLSVFKAICIILSRKIVFMGQPISTSKQSIFVHNFWINLIEETFFFAIKIIPL